MIRLLLAALLAQAAAAQRPFDARTIDACALLADADIRAALGVAVKARRPGTAQARGLALSQCYLDTGTPRSVSVAVAGPPASGGAAITPRAFWRDQFHRGEDTSRGGDERERDAEARSIQGLGDEAFWSGTRVAGALYVLRGDAFIRISVGGIGAEAERIEKSRQLAAAALARLQAR